ncbi:MAG: hypothetical protein CMM91_05830 [Rickettsiales bacterium]|jgi:hypothetical protein|nr:hypothetical protein [Rickettsiales bacterium]MAI84439.1 hypothetical protein [Rickettsiales bacterium]|tara:strand:+ start:10191 stop:10787 length:597 start_codon:yes stop_codon:yes gene_type:complete
MAQSSTTLIGQTTMETVSARATISFNSTEKKVSDSDNGFGNLVVNDIVTISGTSKNNGDFTITAVATDGSHFTVAETINKLDNGDEETADGSTNFTVTQTGLVSDKVAGDGYYSQPDGVHTVAYQITDAVPVTANFRMQGSLATTPTESDWFDITGSGLTPDLSTLGFYANFTGNFVWVRCKATGITAGAITKVLYNN